MVRRFGIKRLAGAVAKVEYRGSDLSHLCVTKKSSSHTLGACGRLLERKRGLSHAAPDDEHDDGHEDNDVGQE
jgi:hypothetical protein